MNRLVFAGLVFILGASSAAFASTRTLQCSGERIHPNVPNISFIVEFSESPVRFSFDGQAQTPDTFSISPNKITHRRFRRYRETGATTYWDYEINRLTGEFLLRVHGQESYRQGNRFYTKDVFPVAYHGVCRAFTHRQF